MSSIFGILQAGKSAVLAQQKGLEVTGQNISNVNTPGYTRRRLNLTQGIPIASSAGPMGTGVIAKGVERVYDGFLGAQINQEEQEMGRWEARKDALDMTEIRFSDAVGGGLSKAMGEFWNAWQDLANDPSGYVQRVTLLGKGEDLAHQFQSVYDALSPIPSPFDDRVEDAVTRINLQAAKIADLNQKIVQVETSGDNANEQRDSRDMALKELSSLIDINTFEQENGTMTIKLGDGKSLVDGVHKRELTTMDNAAGHKEVCWTDSPSASINDSISSGALKGLIETRDEIVPGYMSSLESLAGAIKAQINDLHADGFGLAGSTGVDFFTGSLSSGKFAVNSAIVSDTDKIAAAQTSDGLPGDNRVALAIADLQSMSINIGNADDATFSDYYHSIVSRVGADVQYAATRVDSQSEMMTYLDNYRESVSGVSLDEEMINLIQYQRSYQSAAKLVSVVDEMLATLLNSL
jgi:flagellar hook-associated protein 1 FlgK